MRHREASQIAPDVYATSHQTYHTSHTAHQKPHMIHGISYIAHDTVHPHPSSSCILLVHPPRASSSCIIAGGRLVVPFAGTGRQSQPVCHEFESSPRSTRPSDPGDMRIHTRIARGCEAKGKVDAIGAAGTAGMAKKLVEAAPYRFGVPSKDHNGMFHSSPQTATNMNPKVSQRGLGHEIPRGFNIEMPISLWGTLQSRRQRNQRCTRRYEHTRVRYERLQT